MNDLETLKSKIQESKSTLIIVPESSSLDTSAAALAWYLSLEEAGRPVTIASAQEPTARDSHLVGVDKIKQEIGNSNLVISFPYEEDIVEKVSYNVDGGKFNLVIQPKEGSNPIEKDSLSLSYTGSDADLIIFVGAQSVEDAGQILEGEKDILGKATIVNVSNMTSSFGSINLVDPNASLSEIVAAIIQEAGLPMSQDIANNLMFGILDATDNLQSPRMTADTFEALAMLYRAGARRENIPSPSSFEKESIEEVTRGMAKMKDAAKNKAQEEQKVESEDSSKDPEPDWLKPKIFKGGTKV